MEGEVADLFREQSWSKELPQQLVIPSLTLKLSQKDVEYLIDDNTNPDPKEFALQCQVSDILTQFKGSIFAKFQNRSAKDCSVLDRKVVSVEGLILLVKMSEYLTEALGENQENEQGAELVIRQYKDIFENEVDQFRVYVIDSNLVGICQKNPSFLSDSITTNQIESIRATSAIVHQTLLKTHSKESKKVIEFVLDLHVSPNGHQSSLFALEPFHVHSLSLFTEQQLRQYHELKKEAPKVKMVEQQDQLKKTDLSEYKAGSELKNMDSVKEWIEFMEKEGKQSK